MKLVGISKGFSTNSSSKHSIIINRSGKYMSEDYNFDPNNLNFGRNYFALNTEYSKLMYLASQLYDSFETYVSSKELRVAMISKITGLSESDLSIILEQKYHLIDHQSRWRISPIFELDFYKEMVNFFKNKDVIILGGNDEEDLSDYDLDTKNACTYLKNSLINIIDLNKINKIKKEFEGISTNITAFVKNKKNKEFYPLIDFKFDSNIILKKDKKYWVSFDPETGNKVRFTFDLDAKPYTKATVPELVDLNITEYCNLNCPWCYKAAESTGKHAVTQNVTNYLDTLNQIGVFEIALGGGEPTTHPDFDKIISRFEYHKKNRIKHIRISFSTYSTEWLGNKKIVDAVKNNVAGIGVSVHTLNDIKKVEHIAQVIREGTKNCDRFYDRQNVAGKPQIMAQHVFGTRPLNEVMSILDYCQNNYLPILLLGYKTTGRGSNNEEIDYRKAYPEEYKDFVKMLSGFYGVISVDTLFVNKYKDLLDRISVSRLTYTEEEGKFSCYIDAVNDTIAASSFSEDKIQLDKYDKSSWISDREKEILNDFKKF